VAQDKGFYREVGFASELQQIQSSPQAMQMAITGGYQIATSQPDTFIAAFVRGATQLGALASPTNENDWVLVGNNDVRKIEDLEGKTIGLSSLRGSEAWATTRLLDARGVKRDTYNYVVAGVSPAKVAALARGAIGAAVLFQPSAEAAIRQGLPALATYAALRSYPTVLYVVNREWAAKGDAGKRAAAALRKAHAWMWDRDNRKECEAILAKYTKRDASICEKIYQDYFIDASFYSKTGALDVEGFQRVLDDMAADGAVFTKAPPARSLLLEPALGGMAT
jgi:ABC-type nitrate/sulfonate/bicarbonate transport system substrate-binding protein